MDENWTPADAAAAALQGWQLALLWDATHGRLEYEYRAVKGGFLSDDNVAQAVQLLAGRGDKLATKAGALVFQSKTGSLRPEKRRKAKTNSRK